MDYQDIKQLFDQSSEQLIQLNETVAQLTVALNDLMEENNRLRIRNQDLMALFSQNYHTNTNESGTSTQQLPAENSTDDSISGKARLQTFYDEGIHVCHPYFGSQRYPDEECMFCQGVLDGLE
ncbi:initiation-control protein YabA [Fundicoccus sp. Sow4_F4]|uniref:initiation-control protein YabA n=1 Tax=Fundicoccus sp. Sow4_F4 TaxID=3438783 RepID=UPI003F927485